jgi:hypothetical protein
MMDQFTAVAAEILAGRAGLRADDPEPQIAAAALLGLWRIQAQSLSRHLDGTRPPDRVRAAVAADVRRAAALIEAGLGALPAGPGAAGGSAAAGQHRGQASEDEGAGGDRAVQPDQPRGE